jgi:hypothetical protein
MKSSVVDPYDKRRQQPPRRQPEGTPRHCHTIPQPVTARQLLRNQRASHKAQRGCLHLIPPGGTTTCCPGRSKDETNESSNIQTTGCDLHQVSTNSLVQRDRASRKLRSRRVWRQQLSVGTNPTAVVALHPVRCSFRSRANPI